jgi:UDP-GlcNAc:undecaprenyl-phosphate/decaprenyl-phosphate GlcNAc-1-phosphate transferase
MVYFASLLLAFYLTVILVPLSRRLAFRIGVVDEPDIRKVHTTPMPRTGGIALAFGILVPLWLWVPLDKQIKAFFTGAAIIFIFGFLDDLFHLDYKRKFLGQFLAVIVTIIMGQSYVWNLGMWFGPEILVPPVIGIPLTILFLIGVTNAINLADGLDGLAGGLCILIFGCLAFLSHDQDATGIFLTCLVIIGALLGFLRYNTFPATVFMGDTGSQLLGFSAGVLSLYLTQTEHSPLSRMLPALILGFPILDTLAVMTERVVEGHSPFKPDKRHFHHRLLKLGASQIGSVVFIYILQGIVIFLSIYLRYYPEIWVLLTYLIIAIPIFLFYIYSDNLGRPLSKLLGWGKSLEQHLLKDKAGKDFSIWPFRFLNFVFPAGLICLAFSVSPLFKRDWEWISFWILGILIVISHWANRSVRNAIIRFSIYVIGFYVLLNSQERNVIFFPITVKYFNYLFWGGAASFLLVYLVMSKFKDLGISSLDYLLLLLVALVPFLPVEAVRQYQLGMVAFGMIVLLWTSEVLIRHSNDRWNMLSLACLICLTIVGYKGFIH